MRINVCCENCYYHKHKCFQCAINPANDVGLIYLGGKRNTNDKSLKEKEEKK